MITGSFVGTRTTGALWLPLSAISCGMRLSTSLGACSPSSRIQSKPATPSTSAAIGLPIALAGTLGYLVNGWNAAGTPALTLGYVYLPALVLVSLVSMVMAPMGARLAHRLPVALLKKIFAGLLMALCAKMLHSIFG